MRRLFLGLLLVVVSACSDDDAFKVETDHVVIQGQLKPDAQVSAREAKSAIQTVVDGLEKK